MVRRTRLGGPLLLAALLAPLLLPPASDAQSAATDPRRTVAATGAPPPATAADHAGMAGMPTTQGMDDMPPNPGMAQLMAILGPGVACPRGGCGYGLDGIPEPYAGGGLSGAGARAAAATTVYPARNATLGSWVSGVDMTGSPVNANDVWGYVAPSGREYAIVGLQTGTAFVEITDPTRPEVVGVVDGPRSDWRDMAVYGPWAYSVNERGAGIQVIDLRRIDNGVVRLRREVTGQGLVTGHNLFVNEASGTLYVLGSNLSRGGLVAADLTRPDRPVVEPVMWDVTYVHDVEVRTYERGPWAGREIAFAFTGRSGLHIVDVTDRTAPRTLSHLLYRNATYGHSGALSEDGRLLYVNDEFDERQNPRVDGMTTYLIRVADLENPKLLKTKRWRLPFIDHNSMIQGDRLYVSAYQGGLRVVDISQPRAPRMTGWFDTHPEDDGMLFYGAWGVYAGFPSGTVVVTDIQRGLFVITPAAR